MANHDVAIVGAGPAGSTAAYLLATAGASVLLLDKATFPRDKPCGGGVTGRAARLLPFSIEPVVEDVVDRLECGLRYRHRFTRRARGPLAYMTQRRRLDHFLLQKAAEAGAEVREGETADARELDARMVIGADGCNGPSANQLGLADGVVHGVALEAIFLSTFVMISQNRADAKRQVIADEQWQMVQEEDEQNVQLIKLSNQILELTQEVRSVVAALEKPSD